MKLKWQLALTAAGIIGLFGVSAGTVAVIQAANQTAPVTSSPSAPSATYGLATPAVPMPSSAIPADPCRAGDCPPMDNDSGTTTASIAPAPHEDTMRVTFYDGLSLALGSSWDVESSSGIKTANDTGECTSPGVCANFSVWSSAVMTKNWPLVIQSTRQCESGASAGPQPLVGEPTKVGGRAATYYHIPLCQNGTEVLQVWEVSDPRLLITTITGRSHDVNLGLILSTAQWQ